MGVNILAPPEERIGLGQVAKEHVAIHPFRDRILYHLATVYAQWQNKGFTPIREVWLRQAHGLGQPATARLPSQTLEGIFETIDEEGAFILQNGQKHIAVNAGEVFFGS
jgi:BirA family biotin operon repressor/biotin-[acetyl-CoA-carboxylase] ligase